MAKKNRTKAELYSDLKTLVEKNNHVMVTEEWRGHVGVHTIRHNVTAEERGVPGSCVQNGFPSRTQTRKSKTKNVVFSALNKASHFKRTDDELYLNFKAIAEDNGCSMITKKWLGRRAEHVLYHVASQKEYLVLGSAVNKGFPVLTLRQPEFYQKLKALAEDNGCRMVTESWLGANVEHNVLHIATNKVYKVFGRVATNNQFPLLDGQRYVTQEVCRQVFAHIFGGEFKTSRTRLFDRNGKSLELDGYEDFTEISKPFMKGGTYKNQNGEDAVFNYQFAFEYQGHWNHQEDIKTIERDKLKAKICKENGIFLVQIEPPVLSIEKINFYKNIRNSAYMYSYVCTAIELAVPKFGMSTAINFPGGFKLDLSTWNPDVAALKELQNHATENGFTCLETEWLGSKVKHRFLHIETQRDYKSTPDQVMSRQGFPKDLRLSVDMLAELVVCATAAGFECLETEWLGAANKHRFLHIEKKILVCSTPSAVMSRDGFPKDLRTDADRFAELIVSATLAGFECLETEWCGSANKHRFLHIGTQKPFDGIPHNVLGKDGFPKDLRTDTDRLNELIVCATAAGFECLETEWLGAKNKHRFLHIESQRLCEWVPSQVMSKTGFPKDFRIPADRLVELISCATASGFKCLETEWLGSDNKHRFLHIESQKPYDGIPKKVMSKQGFPKNLRTDSDRFSELIACASAAGFECLENKWLGSKVKYNFLHIQSQKSYSGAPGKVMSKQGFPKNLRTDADRFAELIACATAAGFSCHETEWLGSNTKHRFLHIETQKPFDGTPHTVMSKQGFPEDLRTDADRLAELISCANAAGIECLETKWLGSNTRHRFLHTKSQKYYEGYPNKAMGRQVEGGKLKTNASRFSELIVCSTAAGFKCLETNWLGAHTIHRFLHILSQKTYDGTPSTIMSKRGFPTDLRTSADRFAELIACATAAGFECIETEWLGADNKHRFLHIESQKPYDGIPTTVMSKVGFPKDLRTNVDRFAELIVCSTTAGFECLETEWLGAFVKHRFLHSESQKICEWIPRQVMSKVGFPKDLRTNVDRFAELIACATSAGFKCLETQWLGTDSKYDFLHIESQKNYVGTAYAVMSKRGFPKDLRTDTDMLAELTVCATAAGFECLETEWLGVANKHRFLHIETQKHYAGTPAKVMSKRGFPKDLRTDVDMLAELIVCATAAGFECLETEWLGAANKHRFLHIGTQKHYAGTPTKVMSKRGFPKDLRTDVDMLAELVVCATAAGFECLETEWLGGHTIHRFLHILSQKTYDGTPSTIMSKRGFPSRASAGTAPPD